MSGSNLTPVGHAKMQLNFSIDKLKNVVAAGKFSAVDIKPLLNEIEDRAAEVRHQSVMHRAQNLLHEAWSFIVADISGEQSKSTREDWDARVGCPIGTSLHFGDDERRWLYLRSSEIPGLEVRVKLEIVAASCEDDDRTNRRQLPR